MIRVHTRPIVATMADIHQTWIATVEKNVGRSMRRKILVPCTMLLITAYKWRRGCGASKNRSS